ncbi:thymidine kinase [Aquilutibacter rugosus]|uniref:thymidine kinase n=1 Tax=Aquilutibacter rugosus TaxID=3115820 RepID=UPI002F406659
MAKLYFYYSAMNAGKTTTMLQSAHNYAERGMRAMLLTPRVDVRDGTGIVSSRIGLQSAGVAFDESTDLFESVRADIEQNGPLHCVLCDEAQFLDKQQVWQLSDVVDRLRIPVLCYGLRTDFRGELFPGSQALLAIADELVEIKTICHSGKKATMNLRVNVAGEAIKEGPQVEIGGNERYVSVSRAEFKKLMGLERQ